MSGIARHLIIDGNLGSGKSEILRHLPCVGLLNRHIVTIEEPLRAWLGRDSEIGVDSASGERINILEAYYIDKKRNGFAFQSFALWSFMYGLSKNQQLDRLNISERGVQSSVFVFSRLLEKLGAITELEMGVLRASVPVFMRSFTRPDLIYLKTTPEVSFARVKARERSEEVNISLEYLRELHEMYELWLHEEAPKQFGTIFTIDANMHKVAVQLAVEDAVGKIIFS